MKEGMMNSKLWKSGVVVVIVGLAVAAGAQVFAASSDGSPRVVAPAAVAAASEPAVTVEAPAPAVEVPAPVEVAAVTPVGPQQPAEAPAPVWPVPDAPPAPPEGRTLCQIVHADGDVSSRWGVYGVTTLPRGTVFVFTVFADGVSQSVDLVARAGGIVIDGVRYGPVDGYTDDGTTIFGPTGAQMLRLDLGHGPVEATVTLGGQTICATNG